MTTNKTRDHHLALTINELMASGTRGQVTIDDLYITLAYHPPGQATPGKKKKENQLAILKLGGYVNEQLRTAVQDALLDHLRDTDRPHGDLEYGSDRLGDYGVTWMTWLERPSVHQPSLVVTDGS